MSSLASRADHVPRTDAEIATRPRLGVIAVLLGAQISTLAGRLTNFGLADVRGAVHAGFDEGAWIPTAFTVGQMLVGPASVWLGMVFGPRRVLMVVRRRSLRFPTSCCRTHQTLRRFLAFQTVSGLASGTFIPGAHDPVASSQNLPTPLVVYDVAAYSMNIRIVSQHCCFGRRLVRRSLVMAMDIFGTPALLSCHA